jgi:dTDP-4-dehydrorhamnose reductase
MMRKKRVLILGGSGMLGHKLVQCWLERFEIFATLRSGVEKFEKYQIFSPENTLTGVNAENFDSIIKAFVIAKPDVVVNCIGVIKQLKESKNPITTLNINSIFPHRLAGLCQAVGARLITISTDCVFNGRKGNYQETDISDAEDLYGKSKNIGEVSGENCLTVRTSIIGRELGSSHSLVDWFLSNEGGRVKGFTKAIYTGFPTVVFAGILADIIENQADLSGLWHISSEPISKFDLLCLARDAYQAKIEIEPDTEFFMDRSLNSDRFRQKTNFTPMSWPVMIKQMAADNDLYI